MSKRGLTFFLFILIIVIVAVCIGAKNITDSLTTDADHKLSSNNEEVIELSSLDLDNQVTRNTYAKILVNHYKKEANDVLLETNKYRKEAKVGSLVLDDKLSEVASIRAMEIAIHNKFSHVRPDGSYYSKIFTEYKIVSRTSGENLASGYNNGEEVCVDWKKSKGHYANMVNKTYNKLGVGVYTYQGVTYWVQIYTN
jgi:uncharacterized protein YkwD